MYRCKEILLQLTLCLCVVTVTSSMPLEVQLLLTNMIYVNNISTVLYISHYSETERLFIQDINFLMVTDMSCEYPEMLMLGDHSFLSRGDTMRMNIVIDCGSDRPIEKILLKILPLEYYIGKSLIFLLPMVNVIIISEVLPSLDEQRLLYPTKDTMFKLAYITEPIPLSTTDVMPGLQSCNPYSIHEYDQDNQDARPMGHLTMLAALDQNCTIEGKTDILWNTFPGFMGKLVNVGYILNPPFMTKEVSSNGDVTYGGTYKAFLDALSDGLNFTYRLFPSSDGVYGIYDEEGEWNGLIGMLQHMEVDIGIAGLTITAARDAVVDFTIPFWEDLVVAIYQDDQVDLDWFSLFRPFQVQVWLMILVSLMVASFFMWALQFLALGKSSNKVASSHVHLSRIESVWTFVGASLAQSTALIPSSMPSKAVFISFFLTAVLLAAHYTGNLKAAMVAPHRTPRFTSLRELTADEGITIHINGGGAHRNGLATSQRGVLKGIWQIILSREDSLSSSLDEAMYRMTQSPSHVVIDDKSGVLAYLMKNGIIDNCKWTIIPEKLYTSQYALAIPEHSPYRDAINKVVSNLVEMGLIKKWFYEAIPSGSCNIQDNNIKPVNLNQMQAMFTLLATGIVLGIITFIVESFRNSRKPSSWNFP